MDNLYHPRWPIFFQDNHLLVLYKPAGLVMQRDHKGKANLLDLAKIWIKMRYHKPGRAFAGLVHRLDAPVAGVVVVARTSKAASRLSAQFREGAVVKKYLAVVCGVPPKREERLIHHLVREGPLSRPAHSAIEGGRTATLRYRLKAQQANLGLVAIELETGRRHQIRAQLSAIGCPILGDVRYGAPSPMPHGRIALLAHVLAFDHPTQGIRMRFSSPEPMGWPWPGGTSDRHTPFWTLEEFLGDGLQLPDGIPPG